MYKKTATLFFLMVASLALPTGAWGQVEGNKYKSSYGSGGNVVTTSDKTIQHKAAKWHGMRSGGNFVDTFDDTQYFTSGDGSTQIQAAHTYVDTLYVRKGTQVSLWLPTISSSREQNSARYYQRWYNYLTEETFATGLTSNRQVNDILTPKSGTVYRFRNGYVGGNEVIGTSSIMYGANFYYPEDDEYRGYTGLDNASAGNNYYIVACDISGYTDFTTSGNGNNRTFTEPTLGLRVLYYIVGIDDKWGTNTYANQYERLNTADYKRGGDKYLEEYEITFPCDHIGNFTNELVSIARQAQFYRVPGDDANDKLTARLEGTTIFKLVNNGVQNYDTNTANGDGTLTLGDNSRAIFFRKKEGNNNAPWSVLDGTTATILVTKTVGETTYNIARFKLTFKKEIRLLTQHQIARLDEARANNTTITGEGGWFDESYLYRTPAYLDENYILLTSRTFDYDSNVTGAGETTTHQGEYYPYPLAWDFSSYAFYDGTKERQGFDGSTDENTNYESQPFTEWGSYAIVNDYMGYGDKTGSPKKPTNEALGGRNAGGYFLYVDASALPGKLVTLPFTQNLCAGSELLVSAWVKSAGQNNENTDDAAMLFSVYGIDDKNNRTLIHAQTTGQIRRTTNIQLGTGEYTYTNGYGSQQNDWYQVVLSFLNDDPNVAKFTSYEVQIDNNSGSTSGGDFYLDEIKVYISKPLAEVTQLETACSTERTLMNLSLDRERLLARVGSGSLTDGGDDKKYGQIGVVLVDTLLFRNNFNGNNYGEAILASAVDLGISEKESYHSRVLNFYGNFDDHEEYNEDGINLASANDHFFYRNGTAAEDNSSLITDFYGDLTPGRTYWLLLYPYPEVEAIEVSDGTDTGKKEILIIEDDRLGEYFAYFDTDRCAIKADFKVTGDVIIKVDGEIVTPETEFCRGNINNFTVELQIPNLLTTDPDDMITITEGIYFDWFFGEARDGKIADPMTQYTEKVSMATGTPVAAADGISLQEALVAFRNLYPGATALSTTDTPASGDFTSAMYDLINYYLNLDPPVGAQNRPLVLHQPSLNITLLESLRVVVQPIPMSIGMDNLPAGYEKTDWASLCWGYTYLELTTTNAAPTVYPGFNTVIYPTDLTGQSLRIGLDQITSVKRESGNSNTLTVDLRDAKSYKTTDPEKPNTNFTLRLIGGNTPDETYNKLFLTDTDDPVMKAFIDKQGTSFDKHSLPIGVVKSFEAHYYGEGTTEEDNKMEVQFILDKQTVLINGNSEDFTFVPREGYYYTFNVYFEEEAVSGGATACYGRFPLTMKVVPEYLVWNDTQKTDDILGNWNYDGNWLRATNSDIKATKTINEYGNDNRAFVPMLFSKVVIPANSKIWLYQAGYGENGSWVNSDRPEKVADPTQNIQYDLMAFESGSPLKTERYRVSLLDEIHFEPGAEMLHAEYLLYNKAWVDYQLDKGRWYTLASPLKAVYAGDFYTDGSTGTEGSKYFKDITFNTTDNNRFNPSVYQRGWKESGLVGTPGGERAIAGNWSALYNKVDEAYTPGTGFSLKVQDIADNTSATFRLPKADGSYTYYSYDGQTSGNTTSVSRLEGTENVSGRLQSDQLFIRNTDINKAGKGAPIEITLSETAGGNYYLVGNPFMAHLDMDAFFKEQLFNDITIYNGEVLEWKYWYLDDDGTQVAVSYDEESNVWTSTKTGDDFLIPPLRSFFVEKKAEGNEIKFTQDMQVLGGTNDGLRSANALTITATTSDGRTSRAAVAYDMAASADYEVSEDAELFLDSNLGDVPMVYTVAGTMATSINRTSELYNIPLGVYGNKQEMVTLSFGGLNQFSSATLYDAQEQTETPLREGKTISVPAGTSGRYFLRAGTPTGNEVIARNAFLVYSVGGGKVMVTSSNTPLKDIRVYTMGGAQVRSIQASGMQQEIYLNRGIYLITVSDQDGLQETRKVLVR